MENDYELNDSSGWTTTQHNVTPTNPKDDVGWQVARRSRKKNPEPENLPPSGVPFRAANRQQEPRPRVSVSVPTHTAETQSNLHLHQWENNALQFSPGLGTAKSPKKPPPLIVTDADNEAQAQWRKNKLPLGSVRIPADLALQDSSYETLAREAGAYVKCEDFKPGASHINFRIWGTTDNVSAAKEAITGWVKNATKSERGSGATKFAKLVSLSPAERIRHEQRWLTDVRQELYRRYPPREKTFGAIGSFHWPLQEYRPEEIFGMSCEALDPIRVEYSCYVVWIREKSLFQILGKPSKVQAALLRVRKTYFQIAARLINPVRTYMLRWPDAPYIPSHVYQAQYIHSATENSNGTANDLSSCAPRASETMLSEGQAEVAQMKVESNLEYIGASLEKILRKLHYYRGFIQMRIRLGTFLMTSYMHPNDDGFYDLEAYKAMIGEDQFSGEVTEEIGDTMLEAQVLAAIQKADNLLTPQDATTESLASVKPLYSAIFTFTDEAGDLRLTMSWDEVLDDSSHESELERRDSKWTRLPRGTKVIPKLLDISLTDLHTSAAWQFEILASDIVDSTKLPRDLRQFESTVSINTAAALKHSSSEPFIGHAPSHTLQSMRLLISYRYAIKSTDYTVEVTRFQDWTLPERKNLAERLSPQAHPHRWGVAVHRIEWGNTFAQNERLLVGTSAEWSDEMDEWFPVDLAPDGEYPEDKSGFAQFMQKLDMIEKLVRGLYSP